MKLLLALLTLSLLSLSCSEEKSPPSEPSEKAAPGPEPGPVREQLEPIPMAEVVQALQPHSIAVNDCYEAGRAFNPFFGGEMKLGVVVGTSGAVESVEIVESTIDEKAYVDCSLALFKKLRFQPSPKRRRFEYPLRVKPVRRVTKIDKTPNMSSSP